MFLQNNNSCLNTFRNHDGANSCCWWPWQPPLAALCPPATALALSTPPPRWDIPSLLVGQRNQVTKLLSLQLMKVWCNQTVYETYGSNLSPDGLDLLWSCVVSVFLMKILPCFWWDIRGVIYFEVDVKYCQWLDKMEERIEEKRIGVIFHHMLQNGPWLKCRT